MVINLAIHCSITHPRHSCEVSGPKNVKPRKLHPFSLFSTLKLLTDTFAVKQLHTLCCTYIILKLFMALFSRCYYYC